MAEDEKRRNKKKNHLSWEEMLEIGVRNSNLYNKSRVRQWTGERAKVRGSGQMLVETRVAATRIFPLVLLRERVGRRRNKPASVGGTR